MYLSSGVGCAMRTLWFVWIQTNMWYLVYDHWPLLLLLLLEQKYMIHTCCYDETHNHRNSIELNKWICLNFSGLLIIFQNNSIIQKSLTFRLVFQLNILQVCIVRCPINWIQTLKMNALLDALSKTVELFEIRYAPILTYPSTYEKGNKISLDFSSILLLQTPYV